MLHMSTYPPRRHMLHMLAAPPHGAHAWYGWRIPRLVCLEDNKHVHYVEALPTVEQTGVTQGLVSHKCLQSWTGVTQVSTSCLHAHSHA